MTSYWDTIATTERIKTRLCCLFSPTSAAAGRLILKTLRSCLKIHKNVTFKWSFHTIKVLLKCRKPSLKSAESVNMLIGFMLSDNLPTIHKQISFPNIFLNSFTQFFTCRHRNKLTEVKITNRWNDTSLITFIDYFYYYSAYFEEHMLHILPEKTHFCHLQKIKQIWKYERINNGENLPQQTFHSFDFRAVFRAVDRLNLIDSQFWSRYDN